MAWCKVTNGARQFDCWLTRWVNESKREYAIAFMDLLVEFDVKDLFVQLFDEQNIYREEETVGISTLLRYAQPEYYITEAFIPPAGDEQLWSTINKEWLNKIEDILLQ